MKRTLKVIAATVALVGVATQVHAASATGSATQTVLTAISITNVSALAFGSAAAGAVAKTVAPGSAEDAENGSFTVSGQASTAYTITLPTSINMTTGAGGANETIVVNTFTSFPSGTGSIGAGGTQLLLVGATRAALTASQVAGSYTGSYTVDVVY